MRKGEYAKLVNYDILDPFKQIMIKAGRVTRGLSEKRDVFVEAGEHGAIFEYRGNLSHAWAATQEGLGNKNWIAEVMGPKFYRNIGFDVAMMAANDVIAHGALPVVMTDEISAGASDWFEDKERAHELALGYEDACKAAGMTLAAGESAPLRYLVKSDPLAPAPVLSATVVGIIAPSSHRITSRSLAAGDRILGVTSSGIHANGISLLIKRVLALPEKFHTKLPNRKTIGEEALIPTRSYTALVEKLLEKNIDIRALLPGTGSGVAKIAFDKQPFTYRIHSWVEVPIIFQFMREIGVSLQDCLRTFNWGVGYYIFVPPHEVERTIRSGSEAGYNVCEVGVVEEGERKVIFGPASDLALYPPGE